MEGRFANRAEAGRRLAEKLTAYRDRTDAIVLGLPRGGVPVAYEVAQRLGLPLDVFVVRKLGVPGYEELAMGAIASGNVSVLNEDVMRALPNSEAILEMVIASEKIELQRREARYRQDRSAPDLRGRVVILVDDGLATGATMRAAAALRKQGVAKSWSRFRWARRKRVASWSRKWTKRFARSSPAILSMASASSMKTFRRRPMRKCGSCWQRRSGGERPRSTLTIRRTFNLERVTPG